MGGEWGVVFPVFPTFGGPNSRRINCCPTRQDRVVIMSGTHILCQWPVWIYIYILCIYIYCMYIYILYIYIYILYIYCIYIYICVCSSSRQYQKKDEVLTKCGIKVSLEILQAFNNYWMKTTHSCCPLTDLFSHSEKSSSSQPRSSMPSHSLSHPSSLQSTTGTISNWAEHNITVVNNTNVLFFLP